MRPLINPARLVPGLLTGGGGICILEVGITPLVSGQAYIDVVFSSAQPDTAWDTQCSVVNTTDATPLNIWPGIITAKATTGFRLQLNGMPDTGNYFLHWAITPNSTLPVATTYSMSGPSAGTVSVASTDFTVALPGGTTVPGPVTITPSDGGGGGTFTPTTATLTTAAPSDTFTYTPASVGAKTISVTNSGGLTNPANLTYTASAVPLPTYTLSGPSSGTVGVASTNFTLDLAVSPTLSGTVVVTPSSGGGGGTFTPTTVSLTTASPTHTFTYTPASAGAKTISVTNDRGLTNPGNLTYTASVAGLADGDPVSTWYDSSVNGNNATQTGGARPTYKTNIVNSKPVVRFTVAGSSGLNLGTAISGVDPFCILVVMKQSTGALNTFSLLGNGTSNLPIGPATLATTLYIGNRLGYKQATAPSVAFHVFTATCPGGALSAYISRIDGSVPSQTEIASANSGDFIKIGGDGTNFSDGDIAEIIIYNATIGSTDRENVEKYLGTKYAITVAAGSAVQPDTVTGLKGWWKADSL